MAEISLAPMMKVTTPFFRRLIRKLSPSTILFTEMIVSNTVTHVTPEKLDFLLGEPEDQTVVQLGGSNPEELAAATKILLSRGWKHFNLNCGCPSDRVQAGKFGAILMLDPKNVADIINEIYKETGVVISLKIRVGVDENDSYEWFRSFISYIAENTPCIKFYVHARKCWLKGLNPKQNRNIPQLNYQFVYDIKKEFPHLFFSLNGGIKENCESKIQNLDGLMIGRHAWDDVTVFSKYEKNEINIKQAIKEYIEESAALKPPKHKILMPLINLRKGRSLTKALKQTINQILHSEVSYEQIFPMIEKFID